MAANLDGITSNLTLIRHDGQQYNFMTVYKLRLKDAKNNVGIGTWLFSLIKAQDGAKSISKVWNLRLKSCFITSGVDYT